MDSVQIILEVLTILQARDGWFDPLLGWWEAAVRYYCQAAMVVGGKIIDTKHGQCC